MPDHDLTMQEETMVYVRDFFQMLCEVVVDTEKLPELIEAVIEIPEQLRQISASLGHIDSTLEEKLDWLEKISEDLVFIEREEQDGR